MCLTRSYQIHMFIIMYKVFWFILSSKFDVAPFEQVYKNTNPVLCRLT